MEPSVLVLYNPVAGAGAAKQCLPGVVAALRTRYSACDMEATQGPGSAAAQVRNAAAAGYTAIVVCGGDGTLFEALQGIVGTQLALGVVPLGTGNVVARDLGLSLEPVHAAKQLVAAESQWMPAGVVRSAAGEQFFLASAGAGVHAELMALPKMPGGGRLHYFRHGARMVLAERAVRFGVTLYDEGGTKTETEASELLVTRVRSYGGVLRRWRPGCDLASASMAVTIAREHHRMKTFLFLGKALLGMAAMRESYVMTTRAVKIVCKASSEPVVVQADGTVVGELPVEIRSVAAAVRLMVPAGY